MDLLVLLGVISLLAKPRRPNGGRRNEPGPEMEPGRRDGQTRLITLDSAQTTPRLIVLESAEVAPQLVVLPPAETAELPQKNSLFTQQGQPEFVETSETPIEFRLCLLSSPDWGAGIRRLSAVAGSVLVHAALLIAVMDASGGKTPNAHPKYHLEILHLQQPTPAEVAAAAAAEELWNTLHRASQSSGKPLADGSQFRRPSFGAGPRRKSRAPQTLIVENAPPDLKINQAIPLPMAVSWTLQPLPPKQEQVRLDSAQAPALETVHVPEVKIISLPDPLQQAPNAVTIPKVNQSAQDSQDRNSTVAEAHDAAAEESRARAVLDEARVRAEEAAKARAALDESRARAEEAARARAALDEAARAEEAARIRAALEQEAKVRAATEEARARSAARDGTVSSGASSVQPAPDNPGAPKLTQLTQIDLPPDGKARSAILSESPQMPGRIVATIYLRVGLRKNWTLEYWLQGGTTALDPPWAYTMFRPIFTLPPEADALLVRGRLNAEGRLEQLALLVPVEWAQKDSLFRALEQWKFRAAAKNGQPVAVEVLLVIPRQDE